MDRVEWRELSAKHSGCLPPGMEGRRVLLAYSDGHVGVGFSDFERRPTRRNGVGGPTHWALLPEHPGNLTPGTAAGTAVLSPQPGGGGPSGPRRGRR